MVTAAEIRRENNGEKTLLAFNLPFLVRKTLNCVIFRSDLPFLLLVWFAETADPQLKLILANIEICTCTENCEYQICLARGSLRKWGCKAKVCGLPAFSRSLHPRSKSRTLFHLLISGQVGWGDIFLESWSANKLDKKTLNIFLRVGTSAWRDWWRQCPWGNADFGGTGEIHRNRVETQ